MKSKIIFLFFLISIILNAQSQDNSDVSQREFFKIQSYPIESLSEYYSDILNFLLISSSQEKNEKFGFIFSDGRIFKSGEFDYASDFKGEYANIIKDNVPGLLFKNGDTKYFPEYDITYWNEDNLGLAIKNNKYGFIDKKGKVIVSLSYDDAFPFYKGYASVKKGEKWLYIDKKGNELEYLKELETSYKPIIENKVLVSDTKQTKSIKKISTITTVFVESMTQVKSSVYPENLYDLKRKKLLNFSIYDDISGYYENGLMKVMKNGKIGFVDENNQIVIPIIYDHVNQVLKEMIVVKKGELWGVIDIHNNILIPFEYNYLSSFYEGLAFFTKDKGLKKIGYINSSNQIVIQPELEFHWYGNFKNGMAVAKKNEKFGFIDKKGKFIIPNEYIEAYPFVNGVALVRLDNKKFTFINIKGENILKNDYKQLYPLKHGFARYIN